MANDATGISRKRDVFQLDDNGAPDADTSDAVGWSRDDGLGYRMLYAGYPHDERGDIRIDIETVSAANPNLSSVAVNDEASIGVWVGIRRSLKLFFRPLIKR